MQFSDRQNQHLFSIESTGQSSRSFVSPKQKENSYVQNVQTTNQILKNLFEKDLSVHSPSKRKQIEEMRQSVESRDSQSPKTNVKQSQEQIDKMQRSIEALTAEMQDLDSLPIDQKINRLCQQLSQGIYKRDVKLGSILAIFEILQQDSNITSSSLGELIAIEVLKSLDAWEEQDEQFIECALEVIAQIGQHPAIIQNLAILSKLLFTNNSQAAYACLYRLGRPGLKCLVENSEKHSLNWILEQLAQELLIQTDIIVPSLARDLQQSNVLLTRTKACAALNRLYHLCSPVIQVIEQALLEGTIDRQLAACTLKGCGKQGEAIILSHLRNSDDVKVKMAITSVLCWRVPQQPNFVQIRVQQYPVTQMPGHMCHYEGPLVPVPFQNEEETCILILNSRDLLAALLRYMRLPEDSSIPPEPSIDISRDSVFSLIQALKDKFEGVRETAASALGVIGVPEAIDAADHLIRCLRDSSPQVRAMSAWALGRIGPNAWKSSQGLQELLKDGYWKVRTAACEALGQLGQAAQGCLPALARCLKDGSINRDVVAQTMAALGPQGEKMLIEMISSQQFGRNYRTSIVKALATIDINSPLIDFVVQTLFKVSNDKSPAVRQESVISIYALYEKGRYSVPYLKAEAVLPFLFRFLKDSDKGVRKNAIHTIVQFGAQGELMLIEGLTKHKDPKVRAYSSKGLGLLGPHTLRVLLMGFHDPHPAVRKSVDRVVQRFNIEDFNQAFWDKIPTRQALLCAIKEVLSLPYPLSSECTLVLGDFLRILSAEFEEGGRGNEFMASQEKSMQQQYSQYKEYEYEQQELENA